MRRDERKKIVYGSKCDSKAVFVSGPYGSAFDCLLRFMGETTGIRPLSFLA